jgi:hypothetical protein
VVLAIINEVEKLERLVVLSDIASRNSIDKGLERIHPMVELQGVESSSLTLNRIPPPY